MSVLLRRSAGVVIERVALSIPVESAVVSFSGATDPAILESSLDNGHSGRFSIFTCDPVSVFSVGLEGSTCPFGALADEVARYPVLAGPIGGLPFVGQAAE